MQVWCDWQLTLCDPHLSALEVRFHDDALYKSMFTFTFTSCGNRHWTRKRLHPDSIRDSNDNFRFTGPYIRLIFEKHDTAVAKSSKYIQRPTVNHLSHPSYADAGINACSLILPRIDYCNAPLHGAPISTMQNNVAWYVEQRIRMASWQMVTDYPAHINASYLSRHFQNRSCMRNLWSSGTPLLFYPFATTDFADRGFRHSALAIWNSLPRTILESKSLTDFKSISLRLTILIR